MEVGRAAGERVTVAVDGPLDLHRTLAPLGHGPYDPAYRVTPTTPRPSPRPPGVVRDAWRCTVGLRLLRTDRVFEALVPAVLEQRVVTSTAWAAWSWLVRHHGERAPGPTPDGMRVPPPAEVWAGIPVWDFHRAGVDPRRARAIVAAARRADGLPGVLSGRRAWRRRRYPVRGRALLSGASAGARTHRRREPG